MDDTDIPQDVQVLLFQDVQTFEQLESLLLLRGDPTTEWSAGDVGARLGMREDLAVEALEKLAATGLVAATGSAPALRYRYSPASRTLDDTTGRLASAYESHRFEILRLMLERPGDIVTREQLRRRLWPDGTFVDFEHSLNAAVKRLRAALGDDAENPRFVETLPRRGYRFIAPLTLAADASAAPSSTP